MRTLSRSRAIEVLLLSGLAAGMVTTSPILARTAGVTERTLDVVGYALLVVPCLALLLRRRYPIAALVVTVSGSGVYAAMDYPGVVFITPVLLALYTAMERGWRAVGVATWVVATGVVLLASLAQARSLPAHEVADGPLIVGGWLLAVIVAGEAARSRRALAEASEQRAVAAEQAVEETAQRRVGEERLRIARELHDSLTHTLSVMNVQAGVAVHLLDKRADADERTYAVLSTVKGASQEALRELRATLGVLRVRGDAPGPPPSLRRLDELVASVNGSDVTVRTSIEGRQRELPAEVDRAAYRIAQEALTNAARHAPGASVTVRVGYHRDALTVDVQDSGAPGGADSPVESGGHGLVGMRERAGAVGGTLRAGPRSPSGFGVHVWLPTPEDSHTGRPPAGLDRG